MKLLVTGGCGFMGSNFIRHILEKYEDYHIINLDKLTYAGNPENLKDIQNDPRYHFVKGDIADEKIVDLVMAEGVDAVINYAAETHVDRSIMHPKDFIITDVLGTHTLLEGVKKHGIKRYIQISTDEVFGSIEKGSFKEDDPFEPNSPYAASKAGGDLMCRAYAKTYDTPVIVTHACNNFGLYHYPEKIIPLFITNLIEGKKVPVYGDGKQVREWIYAKDHANAIDVILHRGAAGEVYNIGTGDEVTNIDLTKKILKLMNKDESMIDYVKDRAGHDRRYAINSEKLRALGWKPKYKFDDALKETVEWFTQHSSWWKPLKSGDYEEYYKKQYFQR